MDLDRLIKLEVACRYLFYQRIFHTFIFAQKTYYIPVLFFLSLLDFLNSIPALSYCYLLPDKWGVIGWGVHFFSVYKSAHHAHHPYIAMTCHSLRALLLFFAVSTRRI